MTAAVTNPMSIVYGSLTMGSTSDYLIDGPIHISTGPATRTSTVSARIVVQATTTANLLTATAALEAAFKVRFQRLRVIVSSSTFVDWNPSTDSGLNMEPSCVKAGDVVDSGLTRAYDISVSAQMPADDNTGRVWSEVSLDTLATDQRRITVTGRYTASGGTSARANYEAKIDAYTAAIKTAIGGTYEKVDENATADDQNKILDFRQVFEEIIYNQSSSAADNAAIKRHSVNFSRTAPGPGDTPLGGSVRRLQDVIATYECEVDESQTTDLHGLWKNTMRPYILAEAERIFQPGQTTITAEAPSFDKARHRFTGTLTMQMSIGSNLLIQHEVSQTKEADGGKIFVGRWDGNPFSYYVYQGPRVATRTTVIQKRVLNLATINSVGVIGTTMDGSVSDNTLGFGAAGADWDRKSGWVMLSYSQTPTPRKVGLADLGREIDVTDWVIRVVEQYVSDLPSGGTTTPGDLLLAASGSAGRASSEGVATLPTGGPGNVASTSGGSTYVPTPGGVTIGGGDPSVLTGGNPLVSLPG